VIERPDLYHITCNGRPVTARAGDWWLDHAFGRIPLRDAAKVGENIVTLRAAPFTLLHELEPAYVTGSFSVQATERGFALAPDRALQRGPWKEQGHPFYGGGVSYRMKFDVPAGGGRRVVALPSWYGAVAKVLVNGRTAGYVTAPPWECDVTSQAKRGENEVEVVVFGTLKNTLGPHHGKHPLGSAWPRMFQTAPKGGLPPGADYDVIGYGLNEPFVLRIFD
jgi:hypothetical protein